MDPQSQALFDSYEARSDLRSATFSTGCFWCSEAFYQEMEGIEEVISGYSGGHVEDPSYEEVMSGSTGHRESIRVYYDPKKWTYRRLVDEIWNTMDPTDGGGQFYDRGFKYTTAIFYEREEERQEAEASREAVAKSGRFNKPIATEILPLKNFYPAESFHQDFYKHSAERYAAYKKGSGREDYFGG